MLRAEVQEAYGEFLVYAVYTAKGADADYGLMAAFRSAEAADAFALAMGRAFASSCASDTCAV